LRSKYERHKERLATPRNCEKSFSSEKDLGKPGRCLYLNRDSTLHFAPHRCSNATPTKRFQRRSAQHGSSSLHNPAPLCAKVNRQSLEPTLVSRAMENHVPFKRLLDVAAAENLIFSMEEFNHLKTCSECFTTWTEFIWQLVRHHELNTTVLA